MNKIRIIHIDDDKEMLIASKKIFNVNPILDYQGGFNNGKSAIDFIKGNFIDLIFCDVEMPDNNGFWVANNLPYSVPIVFITAHANFAIKAFDACALHYLLKPFSAIQLNEVVERFQKQELKQIHLKEQIAQLSKYYLPQNIQSIPKRIFINSIGKISVIDLEELMFLTNEGNYTKFSMINGEVHTASKNLKIYDDALTHHPDFIRIHRTYIINKKFVKQIIKINTQQWFVELKNGTKLELSKLRINEILEQLNN